MHIPDGFLDTKTVVSFTVISAASIVLATNKIRERKDNKYIPLMGVIAAFIFAAQMLNFPVAGGTSGHFMGGVLAAILLGPLTGFLIMSVILIIQCLLFQDGGITALGANIFNMGIIGSILGYYIYKFLSLVFKSQPGYNISIFIAGWLSIVVAACCCAIQLGLSGTVPLNVALPAMAGIHSLIGIGEGLITLIAINFIKKTRSDLLELEKI